MQQSPSPSVGPGQPPLCPESIATLYQEWDQEQKQRQGQSQGNDEININIDVAGGSGQDNDNEKVTICHDGNTLEVAASALPAHYGHGDTLGPCAETAQAEKIDKSDDGIHKKDTQYGIGLTNGNGK